MRVLVTGRDGQLALSLAERASAFPDLALQTLGRPGLDLERPETIAEAIRDAAPDVVVNAAAYTAVDQAEDEPERAFRINSAAAGELAEAARRVGARIVQVSTDYVFDGTADGAYDETAPTHPLGVYGASKLEGERRVADANPEHLILRTAWVYSPFGRNFVRTMLNAAKSRDELNVVDDQNGNPTSALDIADGILAILSRWRSEPGQGLGATYHLAGTGTTSWFGLARHVFAQAALLGLPTAQVRPIRTEDWPTRATRPRNSRLDCARLESDFGFRAPMWQESVAETVRRLAAEAWPGARSGQD
jgi:dTDP-4-dehydrorhamnose reductase